MITVSKHKLKNYLAEKVASNLLQSSEEDLYNLIRYDGIKGFELYSDNDLFQLLIDTIPEFALTECSKIDNNNFYLEISKEHANNANDITVDITRIIQMKMLG